MKSKILPIAVTVFATIFSFVWQVADAQYTDLLDFSTVFGDAYGIEPVGSLISDGTYLYGMTNGSIANRGNIYRVKLDGTGYQDLLDFVGANGASPNGSLITDGTYLYGMTSGGGANGDGLIFKIMPDGEGYQDLLDFNGTNGATPNGSLITDGTYLYGMTYKGGANSDGLVFKLKPDGTGYQDLLDFNGANGASPNGSLITDGTYLYGMTQMGGANGGGLIFKIKPDSTGYQDLLDFSATTGAAPSGSLISDGIYLYGMTQYGNVTNGKGVVFKVKLDGTGYQDLLDFEGPNGTAPFGSLISVGSYLYGMTSGGGAAGVEAGLIFKIKPDGTGYQDLFNFNGTNGLGPRGSLITDSNYLYGVTGGGGLYGDGVVFKLKISSTLPLTLVSFTGQLQHGQALLNWQTTDEINTKSFTVERSADGLNFTPLGSISATDAIGANNYNYTDATPHEGENYYRLKMFDKDSNFTYSGTVPLNNSNMQFALNLYPNPAGSNATLGVITPVQGKYSIAITDATGKTLKRINGVSAVGANSLQLDVQGLAAGVYIVIYTDANGVHNVKMVKE